MEMSRGISILRNEFKAVIPACLHGLRLHRFSRTDLQLRFIEPVEQEKKAYQKWWTCHYEIGRPVLPPGRNQVQNTKPQEDQSSHPFPAPSKGKRDEQDIHRDEVHKQSENCFPKAIAFSENIQRENLERAQRGLP
jgi:hypothetical protein